VPAPAAVAAEDSRRAALARLAAWTPPAMLTLMLSARASPFSPPAPPG
jgi:hypothetical protein